MDWKPGERLIFNALDREWVEEIFCECLEELSTEHADSNEYMVKPFSDFFSQTCSQFEIVWQASGNTRVCAPSEILKDLGYKPHKVDRGGCGVVNGKRVYSRILIKRLSCG